VSNEDYIGEYDIVEYIALGFLTHNDSYDKLIRPGDGHLRFDGSDIYFIDNNSNEKQSHTMNHAIKVWLEKGFLTRRKEVQP
jgi:hypothetical protein